MRLGVFTDYHLNNSNSKFRLNQDGVSDLMVAQEKFVDFFVDNTKDCDVLIFLGDYTDRSTLDPITQTFCNRTVRRILESKKPTILLEGNHCISDKEGVYTVLSAIGELSNFDNVNFVVGDEVIEIGQTRFYCVPYRSDYPSIEEKISKLNSGLDIKYVNVLLFHLPTVNALLDNGVKSKRGVNLSKDITSNFNICLGGDFHTPQQLVGNSDAYYVGAPFSMKAGDIYERGFWKVDIDFDGYTIEKFQNPYNYNIANMSSEQFLDYMNSEDSLLSRSIIKIDSEPSEELLELVSKHRNKFYSLNVCKKYVPTERVNVSAVEVFSHNKDLEVIGRELERLTNDKEIYTNAISFFQKIVER